MLEAELQKQVLKWLSHQAGYFHWRQYTGPIVRGGGKHPKLTPNHLSGFPDIFGFHPSGRAFAIELKSQSGRLSDKQKVWLKNLEGAGVYCIVAKDLDFIISELKNMNDSEVEDQERRLF